MTARVSRGSGYKCSCGLKFFHVRFFFPPCAAVSLHVIFLPPSFFICDVLNEMQETMNEKIIDFCRENKQVTSHLHLIGTFKYRAH